MPFDWLVGFPPFQDSLIQLDVNGRSELWDWRHVCWQLPDSTQAPRLCHTVLTDSISLLDWTIAKHFHGDHVIIRGGQDCALMQDGPIRTLDPLWPVAQEQESVHTHTHTHSHTQTIPLMKTVQFFSVPVVCVCEWVCYCCCLYCMMIIFVSGFGCF